MFSLFWPPVAPPALATGDNLYFHAGANIFIHAKQSCMAATDLKGERSVFTRHRRP